METNKDRAGFSCEFLKFNSYGSESLKAAGRFQRHGKGGGHMHQIERVDWREFRGVLADFSIYNLCFILIFILKKNMQADSNIFRSLNKRVYLSGGYLTGVLQHYQVGYYFHHTPNLTQPSSFILY